MNITNESIVSIYNENKINEELVIYNGKFQIYSQINIKCEGSVYYNIVDPVSIVFKARIYKYSEICNDIEEATLGSMVIEISGYKLMNAELLQIKNDEIYGYISDVSIKSKDNVVDYVQFDIINMDKFPGKLVNHNDVVYAGRIEFKIDNYIVIIDKSYEYNKSLHNKLVSKSGSVITHTGRIYKNTMEPFKTKNIESILYRISSTFSFCCGRHINIPNAFGYRKGINLYRSWRKMYSSDYKFVFNWTSTISNYHNLEKFASLMCKKLEDTYYYETIIGIIDWYIEALNGINLGNNIISIQTVLEMLSYVLLVETDFLLTKSEFDTRPANQNIRLLLNECEIDYTMPRTMKTSEAISDKFEDGVDLITYYRNMVVHPSKAKRGTHLSFEDMWNIILLGINYIELVILYIINYKGEYTNRFIGISFGDVEIVPWSKKNNFQKSIDN
ncbi:hypothetical protein [Peptostreptococcus faecalis]|uniref:hypothetical protein n=1 Tax=Peptostreptococcus faecalis TaxID=2045015 RepID=UPI000C7C027A|nr:hypothetical protein [Peptostreptococcus faecalis]